MKVFSKLGLAVWSLMIGTGCVIAQEEQPSVGAEVATLRATPVYRLDIHGRGEGGLSVSERTLFPHMARILDELYAQYSCGEEVSPYFIDSVIYLESTCEPLSALPGNLVEHVQFRSVPAKEFDCVLKYSLGSTPQLIEFCETMAATE